MSDNPRLLTQRYSRVARKAQTREDVAMKEMKDVKARIGVRIAPGEREN
jgi:hypothetical protein